MGRFLNAESQGRRVRRDWKQAAPAGPSVRAAPQPQHGRPPTPAGKDVARLCICSWYEDFVSATKCRRNGVAKPIPAPRNQKPSTLQLQLNQPPTTNYPFTNYQLPNHQLPKSRPVKPKPSYREGQTPVQGRAPTPAGHNANSFKEGLMFLQFCVSVGRVILKTSLLPRNRFDFWYNTTVRAGMPRTL